MTDRAPCSWCGGLAIVGTTCPKAIACRRCGASPGQSCQRPSGHRADQLHLIRVNDAEHLPPTEGPTDADAS